MAESQYLCPACVRPLVQRQGPHGVYWECEGCSRRLISLSTLKKTTNFSFVSQLRQDVRAAQPGEGGLCPVCKIPMRVVTREAGVLCFQICIFCEMIWLGEAERASLPAPPPEREVFQPLPEKAAELIARLDTRFPSQTSSRVAPSRPDEALLWFLGVPPKPGGEDWVRFPWMTLLLVVTVIGFNGLSSYLIGSMFPTWQWNPSLWPGGA
jgi:ribosomal protein L37AE/L43A